MKRKWLALALVIVMAVALLAACNDDTKAPATSTNQGSSSTTSDSGSSAPAASNDTSSSSNTDSSAPPPPPAANVDSNKNSIVIGGSRPITGHFALFEETGFGPVFRMWVSEVNAAGGIYVEEYGKKLPIEVLLYDDGSDTATMLSNLDKLILDGVADILIPPCSTADLFAAVPRVCGGYGRLLIGAEGGAQALRDYVPDNPTFFGPINNSETQIPAMVEVLKELGCETAYICYVEDLYGVEYAGAAVPALNAANIEILANRGVAMDVSDMTAIITDAMHSGADAFLLLAYPDQIIPAIGTSIGMGYNPKAYVTGPGGNFEFMAHIFPMEGVMGFGAWNAKSSPAAADYLSRFLAYVAANEPNDPETGAPLAGVDWWGHLPYYMSLQVLQQAIERAGTLDDAAIAHEIDVGKFQTVMGEVWFDNNILADECFVGNVGQWQDGIFEVVDVVRANRTADPIVKPAWPG